MAMSESVPQRVCSRCEKVTTDLGNQCTTCGSWNMMRPYRGAPLSAQKTRGAYEPTPMTEESEAYDPPRERIVTGIHELDRVLGGGFGKKSVVLLAGEPGIGKSTLMLQAVSAITSGRAGLYATGEEPRAAIRERRKRLGLPGSENLLCMESNSFDEVARQIERIMPEVAVLDSINVYKVDDVTSAAGSRAQILRCLEWINELTRRLSLVFIVTCHVTKDGDFAGPKALEHLVDASLRFEGERSHSLRTLRADKNRLGSAQELGVFEMTPRGLLGIDNASQRFLAQRPKNEPGSVVTCACSSRDGGRAMMVEMQALTSAFAGTGRRRVIAHGPATRRCEYLLTVLGKKCGLATDDHDVLLNIVGGLEVDDTAVDLAVVIAVASTVLGAPVPEDMCVFGEVCLAGGVRDASQLPLRLKEAAAMGFRRALVGPHHDAEPTDGIELVRVHNVEEAIAEALGEEALVIYHEKMAEAEKRDEQRRDVKD